MVTAKRMTELISGKIIPETLDETLLVDTYHDALVGHTLRECIETRSDELAKYNIERMQMFMYGYAIGQVHYIERIEQFENTELKPNKNDNIH